MNYPYDPRQSQQGHHDQYAGAQSAHQSPWAQQMQAMGGVMPVAAMGEDLRVAFLKKVYTWFAIGLLTTVASATTGFFVIDALLANAQQVGNTGEVANAIFGWGWIGAIIVWMVASFVFGGMLKNPSASKVALFGYNGLFGIVLSFLLYIAVSFAGIGIVWTALLLTGLTFGGLTAYVLTTKADFSWLRGILVVGSMIALGLVLVSILGFALNVQIFNFGDSIWGLVIPGFFILLMAGFTLYDTSKIMRTYPDHLYVAAGAQLSIDFGMMFYYVLMLLLSIVGRE